MPIDDRLKGYWEMSQAYSLSADQGHFMETIVKPLERHTTEPFHKRLLRLLIERAEHANTSFRSSQG